MRVTIQQRSKADAALGKGALALARTTGLTVREARRLLEVRSAIPAAFDEQTAAKLAVGLTAAGLLSISLPGPAGTAARCVEHPALDSEANCSTCRAPICAVCGFANDPPLCAECARKRKRARRFRNIRVAALLAILAGIGGWATLRNRHLDARTGWIRAVSTAVVLVAERPVPPEAQQRWSQGLESLEGWFAREWDRYRPHSPVPMVTFALVGAVEVDALPEAPGAARGLGDRAKESMAFSAALKAIDQRLGERAPTDATIYVLLRPNPAGGSLVEGVAEAGGRRGIVEGSLDDEDLSLELTAVAHELLHLLGATDKYDADGHAVLPQGLAEPDATPTFPQTAAEVMVGEIPLGPSEGRQVARLEDLRVGPATAAEIRW